MAMMSHLFKILVIFEITMCHFFGACSLPDVACPKVFEYIPDGDGFFGRITLSDLPIDIIRVNVRLMKLGDESTKNIGRLSTELDLDSVDRQLSRGEPIKFRVDFPLPNEPVKVFSISVNDHEMCGALNIPPPSETLNLYHTIFPAPESDSELEPPTVQLQPPGHTNENKKMQTSQRPSTTPSMNDYHDRIIISRIRHRTTTAPSLEDVCGRETYSQPTLMSNSTYGGDRIARGKFPWLTAIYTTVGKDFTFGCPGSLISERTVVTAAHCFLAVKLARVLVYLGRNNLDDDSEDGYVARGIEDLIMHPEYNFYKVDPGVDIAIVQLNATVQFTQYITPVCLWYGPGELERITGNRGKVASWGISSVPTMYDVNIVSHAECMRDPEFFKQFVTARTFCAGNVNDIGACLLDHGAGLVIKRGPVWMLRGIVNVIQLINGSECDTKEYVVYSDMAKHVSWLRDNIKRD